MLGLWNAARETEPRREGLRVPRRKKDGVEGRDDWNVFRVESVLLTGWSAGRIKLEECVGVGCWARDGEDDAYKRR